MGGTGSDGGGVSGEEEGSNVIQDIPRKGRDEDSPNCIPFVRRKGWFSLLDWWISVYVSPSLFPYSSLPLPCPRQMGCAKNTPPLYSGGKRGEWSPFFPSCFIRGISSDACERNIFWR